jgi:hypothetical protein
MAAQALAQRFRDEGQQPTVAGSTVTCGAFRVEIAATLENAGQMERQHVAGVGFGLHINGRPLPALYSGVVSTGPSREAALQEAAEDWSRLTGAALASALVCAPTAPARTLGRYRVFSGAVALRGEMDVACLNDARASLFVALEAWKDYLPTPVDGLDFHALSIIVMVDAAGAVQGECRYDGKVSAGLLQAAQGAGWPPGTPTYMFKQFHVLRPSAD